MNAQRDELRTMIQSQLHAIDGFERWTSRAPVDLADAILAAGYTKPRTITTAEELDALPVGSVVLCRGRSWQRAASISAAFDEYKKWRCPDGGFVRSTKDGTTILPASVLYEPGQS